MDEVAPLILETAGDIARFAWECIAEFVHLFGYTSRMHSHENRGNEGGYSQHMIAKVLGISQPAVNGIIRRSRE